MEEVDSGKKLSIKCEVKVENEPQHGNTNKEACVPSHDSDQTGLLHSLIRVFTVGMEVHVAQTLSYLFKHTAKPLNRLNRCPGLSESLCGPHTHTTLLVLSCHSLTLLLSEWPKLYGVLAILSAKGLND